MKKTLSLLTLPTLLIVLPLAVGCGGIDFEVGDAREKEKAKAELRHVVLSPEALKTTGLGEQQVLNGVGADDAASVTGTFIYAPTEDHELHLSIKTLQRNGCRDEKSTAVEFIWRQLGQDDAVVAETVVMANDFFAARAGSVHHLVVEFKSLAVNCPQMSVTFAVQRDLR